MRTKKKTAPNAPEAVSMAGLLSGRQTTTPTICKRGERLPDAIKDKIRNCLLLATHHSPSAIAKACGTTRSAVLRLIEQEPELKIAYDDALQSKIDEVHDAAFEQAIYGNNEVASEKMKEFLLTHHRPDVFGENATNKNAAGRMPQIIVPIQINASDRETEADLPTAEVVQRKGKEGVVIDV
jgi:hypothetical protein